MQEAIAHICRLVAQPSKAAAGSSAPDTQQGEARESSDAGDSSISEEVGAELAPAAAAASQRQPSMPLARQSTTQSEGGLMTPLTAVQIDPSTVLRSYALR